jgi:uncharacterized protein
MAIGTSIAVLLPPIGLGAALEYYQHGNVDIRAAVILAVLMFAGVCAGAYFATQMNVIYLRLVFGSFVFGLGVFLVYGACRRLGIAPCRLVATASATLMPSIAADRMPPA